MLRWYLAVWIARRRPVQLDLPAAPILEVQEANIVKPFLQLDAALSIDITMVAAVVHH